MADSDKQILITPNISQTAQPEIKFVGKDNSPLYIKVLDDNSLSFEGVQGQVFSISPTMSSGDIFSVNDISGVQSIAVNADGNITMDAQSQSVTIKNSGSNTSNLILENTNADAVDGPILELFRNSSSPADGDDLGQILWSAEKSDSTKYSITKMYGEINTVDNSDRLMINIASSGGSGLQDFEYMRFDGGVRDVIFNEGGEDIDIRIEGDSDTALFFTDASSDRIGIGTTSPSTKLHVYSSDGSTLAATNQIDDYGLLIHNSSVTTNSFSGIAFISSTEVDTDTVGASIAAVRDSAAGGTAGDHETNLVFSTNNAGDDGNTERMRITHDGLVGIGTNDPSFTSGTGLEISDATQANLRVTDSNGGSTDFAVSGNDTYILNRHASGKIYIKPGNGDHSIELASDGQVKFNNAYTFPTSDGSANQVLMTDGSDTLSFTTLDISSHTNLAVSSPITLSGDTVGLDDPANLTELNETTDATDDKILLWDESASSWKYMTLDNLQDSIDTTGGGGSGISDIVEDTSPQLGADLDTNSFNIKFDDAHGIRDDSNNEMFVFEKTASADSYIEVHNAVANNTTSNTLFGSDVVGSNTGGAPNMVGPGFAAAGSGTNVALAFKTKGLGNFLFVNEDTTASAGPTMTLMRKHSSEADEDQIGQIKFMAMDDSPTGSDVEDLRDYAKIKVKTTDVSDGNADGYLMISALRKDSHTDFLSVGSDPSAHGDTPAAGVAAKAGQMRTFSSNLTVTRADHAGLYMVATSAMTFNLPAAPHRGEQYIIMSNTTGTVTISANGSDTMNGSTSNLTITTRYEAKTCIAVSDSEWIVLG